MSSAAFETTKGWLAYHPDPSIPVFRLPPGTVDAHCHVFGPGETFAYAPERKYTPCDAPKEKLWALRDRLGVSRNVIVQSTCHGTDNRALVDALHDANGSARGVAAVRRNVDDRELDLLDRAGVRGVRFSFVKRLVDTPPREALLEIAERIRRLGWHLDVYLESGDLPDLQPLLSSLPTTVVLDHMARPDVSRGANSKSFDDFLRMVEANDNMWVKVSCPERLTITGPPDYVDVAPFARRVVEAFPDRVLWGTDWPHPNLKSHMPDDGDLVDYIPNVAVTADLQRKLLVENPMRLYWPDERR